MNDHDDLSTESPDRQVANLESEVQILRWLLCGVMVLMIGFSACADYFLHQQISIQRGLTFRAQQVVESFPIGTANNFLSRLREYSKTHPDFASVAGKYPQFFSQQQQQPPSQPTVKK